MTAIEDIKQLIRESDDALDSLTEGILNNFMKFYFSGVAVGEKAYFKIKENTYLVLYAEIMVDLGLIKFDYDYSKTCTDRLAYEVTNKGLELHDKALEEKRERVSAELASSSAS